MQFFADTHGMDFKSLLTLCKGVLLDWRVIFITVALIIYISLGNYVVKYRKKPPQVKGKPKPVAAAAPSAEGGEAAPAAEGQAAAPAEEASEK